MSFHRRAVLEKQIHVGDLGSPSVPWGLSVTESVLLSFSQLVFLLFDYLPSILPGADSYHCNTGCQSFLSGNWARTLEST